MARKYYENGQEITLTECGCDGCTPSMVNGVLCHEQGCEESWRDKRIECWDCGYEFFPQLQTEGRCCDCAYAAGMR